MRFLPFLFLSLLCIFLACQKGGHWQHFRFTAIEEARERGWTVFVHLYESKTCDEQKKVLEKVIKNPNYAKVGAYRLAWNTEPGVQNYFKASKPCTLIVLKGYEERGRATDVSDERLLAQLLSQGL